MRRASKVDQNQVSIVKALRKIGARVLHLHQLGKGVPDLLCAWKGRNILLEIKLPGEKPNPLQIAFHAEWGGELHIVHSPQEAIEALTNPSRIPKRG